MKPAFFASAEILPRLRNSPAVAVKASGGKNSFLAAAQPSVTVEPAAWMSGAF